MNAPRPVLSDPYDIRVRRTASTRHPSRPDVIRRPYEVASLAADGSARYDTVRAPVHPLIESVCANLARGALVATATGPIAVEDLVPGMKIMTSEYGPVTLQWVGSHTVTARELQDSNRPRLFRIMSDTFGLSKPDADLIVSSRAHILMRNTGLGEGNGQDLAYAPIRSFEDGVSVIGINPISSITLFNLAFDRQATITANGVEFESFHPGPLRESLADRELRAALLQLFPHVGSLSDFGTQLTERLTPYEVQRLREAG